MATKSPASVNYFKVDESFHAERRHVESTAMSRIAVAVLERAVLDAKAGDEDAIQFLTQGDQDLDFWCERAGLDANAVRYRYAHRA